jgi:beta-phosphoglucomutase
MKIKAILFDMDGVLIEAKDWHYEALNKVLSLFGMPISRFNHLNSFDGLPTLAKLELLTLKKGLPRELHNFINEMKQLYTMEIVHTKCKPRFEHEYALSNLKRMGYHIAVCSNSVRSSVEIMMEKSRLIEYLDLMISNEDVSIGKPDPEMYIKSMDYFQVKPEECLILEDNLNGIKAAKKSKGNLMIIDKVSDVNFDNILGKIWEIENNSLDKGDE